MDDGLHSLLRANHLSDHHWFQVLLYHGYGYSVHCQYRPDIFIDELLGCNAPLSAGGQRDSFNALVEDTLGEDCSYDTVLNIHEKLNDLIEAQKDEPEPVVLTKSEVKRLFEECGVEDDKLQSFDEQYEITAGEKSSLVASNITNTRRFEIKTPDVVVHVDPERADLVETRVIDGRKCLVIPMEGEVEFNGIRVHTGSEDSSNEEFSEKFSEDFSNGSHIKANDEFSDTIEEASDAE